MDKVMALVNLFRVGGSVADPVAWKTGQITATVLGTVMIALADVARAFGLPVPLGPAEFNGLAAGAIAVVNVVLTLVTSEKVGVLPEKSA